MKKFACLFVVSTLWALGAGLAPQNVFKNGDGTPCGPEGDAKPEKLKALNRDKNRFATPSVDDIDSDVTLAAMLSPGEDEGRFDQTKAARIVGFVVKVKAGGQESCNCHASDPNDRDTHIELALSPDAPRNQRVVVEVTPRTRAIRAERGNSEDKPSDWKTDTLLSHSDTGILGRWIEVTGWLMFDFEHTAIAENTSPGNQNNVRATCWELHPVTQIKVLGGAPDTTPLLAPSTLRALQSAHAQHVRRDPERQKKIADRNKANQEVVKEDEKSEHP
jgi:hypothetical protein